MKCQEINSDNRGTIDIITGIVDVPELSIFSTGAGFARGGCIHNINDEYMCVISGEICCMLGSDERVLKRGDSILIPRSTPHYFVSLTDSIVIEWGATAEEKIEKHIDTRKIVEIINGKNNTSI